MRRKKRIVFLLLTILIFLIIIIAVLRARSSMRWAQTLKTEDVAKIEAVVHPPVNDKPYKNFTEQEIDSVVKQINQCSGRFTLKPEKPAGASFIYYITMKDGDVHTVANNGIELVIDETYYTGDEDRLNDWLNSVIGEVDSPLPDDFSFTY